MPYCMSLKHKPLALLRAKKDHHNPRILEEQAEQQDVSLPVSSTAASHKFHFRSLRQTQQREQQPKRLDKQQAKQQRQRRRRRSFRRSVKRSIMMSHQQSIMDRSNIPIVPSSPMNIDWMDEVYSRDKIGVNSVEMAPGNCLLTSMLLLATTSNSTGKYLVTEQGQSSLSSMKTTSFQKEIRSAYHQKTQQQQVLTDSPLMMTYEEKKEDDFTTTLLSQKRSDDYEACSISYLKDQLQKTTHLLDTERSKNQALCRNLYRVTSETKTTEDCMLGDHIDNLMETIVRLRNEVVALKGDVRSYRDQYQQEKQRRKELQVRLNHSEEERKQIYEKMHLLMFEHLPAYSPKFNDIGPIDVSAEHVEGMIGQYSIVSKIGKGCFGEVFRAATPSRNEHCAIKCLKKRSFHRYKDVQQVAVEIHILKNYRHPNIVGLVDVVHGPENIYVAMELMQLDLHQYHDLMRRKSSAKQMSEQDAKQALYGILLPLAYLHSHGIAHLDIKPENVLLDWNTIAGELTHYNIRLSDFGLVNMADKPSVTKDVTRKARSPIGTPGFYAPEMILGSKVEGRIADMWSVGCVAMELTLGFTPEWMEAYSVAIKDPATFSDGIESELSYAWEYEQMVENKTLSQMLDGLLQMDPATRFSAEQALAQPWLDDALLVGNQVAVKMEMEPTGKACKPIRKEAYDERSNFIGPPPGYGPI